jgi:GTP-binding protein
MKNAEFVKSVHSLKDLPKNKLPEVVLCGRSNVGKSSFINSLFNNKNLAKISSTPGKTRTINYYLVENKFYLVDLPGFGFAKGSKKEIEKWQKLVEGYFLSETNKALALHFIDSRHDPTKLDLLLNDLLEDISLPYIVLLNKSDKLKRGQQNNAKRKVIEAFQNLSEGDNLLLYSSANNTGKEEIKRILRKLFLI